MKEKIIQFGTGNFLRAFVCDFVQQMNLKGLFDGKMVIVQPTKGGKSELINWQNGRYNLILRGIENGEEVTRHSVIESVSRAVDPYKNFDGYLSLAEDTDMRFIISNTTEAGIEFAPNCKFSDRPALSFPAKLTQLLYRRYELGLGGFVILPCELIDSNGDELKKCVLRYAKLWNLENGFTLWLENENHFCNTLVDRIVTGYPSDGLKDRFTEDRLLDTAELFHLWVIEGNYEEELPLKKAGINVIWADSVAPYKKMKVRILNGAHTSLVFPSLLCGIEAVGDSIGDELMKEFLDTCLFKYILPVIGETKEHTDFAKAVLERFSNPYIKHLWKSIALNSVSKFKARVLPTVTDYKNQNSVYPKPLVFALACLIEYYKTNEVSDSADAVSFIKENDVPAILAEKTLWGEDLSGMADIINASLDKIHTNGIREAVKWTMC